MEEVEVVEEAEVEAVEKVEVAEVVEEPLQEEEGMQTPNYWEENRNISKETDKTSTGSSLT